MIKTIIFRGKTPIKKGLLRIAVKGDNGSVKIPFDFDRSPEDIDLSSCAVLAMLSGTLCVNGSDVIMLSKRVSTGRIRADWLVSGAGLQAGKGILQFKFVGPDDLVYVTDQIKVIVTECIDAEESSATYSQTIIGQLSASVTELQTRSADAEDDITNLENTAASHELILAMLSETFLAGTPTYTHRQSEASDTWVVVHNMQRHPAVTVVDSANNVVEGEVSYGVGNDSEDDMTKLTIKFTAAFCGKAYIN